MPDGTAAVGPTPELAARHEVSAPTSRQRGAHEIMSRVTLLLADGEITRHELLSCHRWRDDWDTGIAGVRAGGGAPERVDCAQGDAYSELRLAALSRLRGVRDAIGSFAEWMLERSVCDDWAYARIGDALNVNHETAKGYVIDVIRGLAAFYALADQCKKSNVAMRLSAEPKSAARHGKKSTLE